MRDPEENDRNGVPEREFALFDLDLTLVPFDTQLLFCNYVLKAEPHRRAFLFLAGPFLVLYGLKIVASALGTQPVTIMVNGYLIGTHVFDQGQPQTALLRIEPDHLLAREKIAIRLLIPGARRIETDDRLLGLRLRSLRVFAGDRP